jgi:hypothetical protein
MFSSKSAEIIRKGKREFLYSFLQNQERNTKISRKPSKIKGL